LTIWIWFAFGTRAHAGADNRRPTPWGWQCSRCPYGHPGAFRVASTLRRGHGRYYRQHGDRCSHRDLSSENTRGMMAPPNPRVSGRSGEEAPPPGAVHFLHEIVGQEHS
jgi:hypothetical protein